MKTFLTVRPAVVRFLILGVLALTNIPLNAEPTAPAVTRERVGQRSTEGIPAIPAELLARLGRYQNTRGAELAGWAADGSVLVITRFGDTEQVHRVRQPLGMREQRTFFREPVGVAVTAPAGTPGFAYLKDEGGSEFWQLWWQDLKSGESRLLTDGKRSRNEQPVLSRDGRLIAWGSTMRNGTDTDVWVADVASGERRNLVERGGAWYPVAFSPDGKRLLVQRLVSINEVYPAEVDVATGKLTEIRLEGGKAAVGPAAYAASGKGFFYVSDEDAEFNQLRYRASGSRRSEALSADIPWDVTAVAVDPAGRAIAFVANEDGISRLYLRDAAGRTPRAVPDIPPGVIDTIAFDARGERLAIGLNRADAPSDVYVVGLADGQLQRWTQSEVGELDPARFVRPELVRYPTFDTVDGATRTIPAFYYRPQGAGPFPVVVMIHGGPEAQALPYFNPRLQFLVNELGIAVLVPNVRGSSGYGKSYLLLDNGLKRKDSVRDIGSLLDWIATRPELDAKRVGVMGGSYGGYMVLASMIDYADRIAAGIELYGISDFVTFLQSTESYRRDLRRAEYGDERDPALRAFFGEISPVRNASRITRPLFAAAGANDPRVPNSETEQIVRSVRANGQDVWYLVFGDEGHGFSKKPNVDYFDAAAALFWQRHLLSR